MKLVILIALAAAALAAPPGHIYDDPGLSDGAISILKDDRTSDNAGSFNKRNENGINFSLVGSLDEKAVVKTDAHSSHGGAAGDIRFLADENVFQLKSNVGPPVPGLDVARVVLEFPHPILRIVLDQIKTSDSSV